MKAKRFRKFLGLSLALAAGLSVVSCGKKKEISHEPDPNTPVVTTKYNITYVSAHGTKPADKKDVTEITAADIAALTDADFEFGGWFTDQACTTEAKAGALTGNVTLYAKWTAKAATTYALTFVSAHGTKPADKEAASEITSEDLAALTDADYKFEGWFTDEACTTEAVAGAITSATTLYAKWTAKTVYDKLVESGTAAGTLVVNEDFSNTTTIAKFNKTESAAGFYQNPSTKGAPKDGSKYDLEVSNGKATATDNDATVQKDDGNNNGKTQAVVNFGVNDKVKAVEGYFDLTMPVAAGNWTFMQIFGSDANKDENEVFGLRTVQTGSGDSKKTVIKYRVDGGNPVDSENEVTIANEGTVGIYYKIDVVTKKLTMKIVKGDTSTDFLTDFVIDGLVDLDYLNVQSSDKNSNLFSIDNIALNVEKFTLDEYKDFLLDIYEPQLTAMAAAYTTNADAFATWKNKIIAAVGNAESIEAIDAMLKDDSEIMLELAEIKSDLQIAVETAVSGIDTKYGVEKTQNSEGQLQINFPNYTINMMDFATAYSSFLTAVSACTTSEAITAAVEAATTALDAVKNDNAAHNEYVASAKDQLAQLFAANYYTEEDTDYNNKTPYTNAFASKDTELATAVTKSEIDTLISAITTVLFDIPTDTTLRGTAATALKESLDSYLATEIAALDQTNFATVIANIENVKTNGKTAIENATTVAEKKAALATAKADVDTQYALTQTTPEQALLDAKDELASYKTTKLTGYSDADLEAAVNAVVLADDETTLDTIDKVSTALTTAKANVDLIIAKYDAKNELETYAQVAYNAIAENNVTLAAEINTVKNEQILTINGEASTDNVAAALATAKSAIDTKKAEIEATEFTVTIVNATPASVTVVYGHSLSDLADPVKENCAFGGWFKNEALTEAFDKTADIYAATTIYAKWYDVVVTTASVTTNADFKSTTFNDATVATFKNGTKTITVKDSLDNDFVFTAIADAVNGVSIDSTNGFKFKNQDACLSFTVVSSCTIEIVLKIGSDGRGIVVKNGDTKYLSITSGGSDNTNVVFDAATDKGTDYTKKKSDTRRITLNNCEPGVYTINTVASQDTYIKSINITESSRESRTTITGIDATVTDNNDGTVTVDSVKLIPQGETDLTKYLTVTDGYEFFVNGSTTAATITDGKISGLSNGDVITVKYGTYTSAIVSVEIA